MTCTRAPVFKNCRSRSDKKMGVQCVLPRLSFGDAKYFICVWDSDNTARNFYVGASSCTIPVTQAHLCDENLDRVDSGHFAASVVALEGA